MTRPVFIKRFHCPGVKGEVKKDFQQQKSVKNSLVLGSDSYTGIWYLLYNNPV